MKRPACLCLGFAFAIALAAASCAINPVTGRSELSLVSEQGEIDMGKQADVEISREYGFYDSPALTQYVTAVGRTIVPNTHRPGLTCHFAVLDSPVVNAFAAPGGYVYVTRGVLALMNSESELAAVLGHELGHISARHSVRKLSQMILVQAGLLVGSALSTTFAKFAGVAGLGAQLLFLQFSRDDEREADALGIEYARKSRYNPAETISFFASLQKYGDLAGGRSLPGFLSTHPLTGERIQNAKAMILSTDAGLAQRREPYLRQIDGLIYGDDPRQGYVEHNAFYHPLLRIQFLIPPGWKTQNTPVQVVLAGDNGNAALIFQGETANDDLAAFARKKASQIEGGQLLNEQATTINGIASYHQLVDIVRQDQDRLRARLSFFRKGSHIYSFTALSRSSDFGRYDGVFQFVVGSFNDLNDAGHLNRQPRHLRILAADGQRALKDYFAQGNAPKESWPMLAVMNGMADAAAIPEKNRLIKIVR